MGSRPGPWRRRSLSLVLTAIGVGVGLSAAAADRLIGPNFQISVTSAGADRDAVDGASAYNPVSNELLVVWQADDVAGAGNDDIDEIFGRRVSAATGAALASGFQITSTPGAAPGSDASHPAVAASAADGAYLVVWRGPNASGMEIFGQWLTPAAALDGAAFQISAAGGHASHPDVVYNRSDDEFLVVWQEGAGNLDEIHGQRLDGSTGALVGPGIQISMPPASPPGRSAANPAVAHDAADNLYMVVFERNGNATDPAAEEIFGRVVNGNGSLPGAEFQISDATGGPDAVEGIPNQASRPDVAFGDARGEFLAVWEQDVHVVASQRLDAAGIELGADFQISSDGQHPAVAYSASDEQYMVVWQKLGTPPGGHLGSEVRGRVLAGNGIALGPGSFRISEGRLDDVNGAVAYDATENRYLATFQADALAGAGPMTEIFGQIVQGFIPDLQLTKSDGGTTAVAGSTIVYTLGFTNVGDGNALDVTLTDTVPAHTSFDAGASTAGWACSPDASAGSVCTISVPAVAAGGGGGSVDFAVLVDDPLPAGVEETSNGASIATAAGFDLDPTDNAAGDITPIDAFPDLTIAKDDGGVSVFAGGSIRYTLDYRNVGNQDATGVVITDTVPPNTRFDPVLSEPGWVCTPDGNAGSVCTLTVGTVAGGGGGGFVDFAVTVDQALPAGTSEIANTASVADDGANGADPLPGNNSAMDTTPIIPAPELRIAKSDGGVQVSPGESILYTLTYANDGVGGATGVTITDVVPAHTAFDAGASAAGWSCAPDASAGSVCSLVVGSLAGGGAGGSVVFAVTLLNPIPLTVTQIANSASIADDGTSGPDPDPSNNTDATSTPVKTPEEQLADIASFVDEAVADGTLEGSGPGGSAENRLAVVIRWLGQAADGDEINCSLLNNALLRTDGLSPPPDFVTGAAAAELAMRIQDLITRLGCE
jgi:uncharacterized repeat protein (TIGR01451 family)